MAIDPARLRQYAAVVAMTASEIRHQQDQLQRTYRNAPELARMKADRANELDACAAELKEIADAIDRRAGRT